MVHAMRQFFVPCADALTTAELQRQIKLAEARRPARFTARQLFFKELSDTAAESKRLGKVPAQLAGVPLQNVIMKRHGARFPNLPEDGNAALERKASSYSEAAALQAREEVRHREAKLQLHQQRLAAESSKGAPPMVLSACRFSQGDVQVLDSMWQNPDFSRRKVAALRKKATEASEPTDAATRAWLGACALSTEPLPVRPPWLRTVCNQREAFKDSALVITDGERIGVFMLLFAKQNPFMAAFAPLTRCEAPFRPQPASASSWDQLFLDNWGLSFSTAYDKVVEAHELGWSDTASLDVISGLVRMGGKAVVADGPA